MSADSDFNIQKANIALLLIRKARLEAEYHGNEAFDISGDVKNKYIQIFDNEYALFLKRSALFDEEVLQEQKYIRMSRARFDAAGRHLMRRRRNMKLCQSCMKKVWKVGFQKSNQKAFSESFARREIVNRS